MTPSLPTFLSGPSGPVMQGTGSNPGSTAGLTRFRILKTATPQTLQPSMSAEFDVPLGSPPRGSLWLIEQAVLYIGGRPGSKPASSLQAGDTPNIAAIKISSDGGISYQNISVIEGFTTLTAFPIYNKLLVTNTEIAQIHLYLRNDVATPITLTPDVAVQLLQANVDDSVPGNTIPLNAVFVIDD